MKVKMEKQTEIHTVLVNIEYARDLLRELLLSVCGNDGSLEYVLNKLVMQLVSDLKGMEDSNNTTLPTPLSMYPDTHDQISSAYSHIEVTLMQIIYAQCPPLDADSEILEWSILHGSDLIFKVRL